TPLRDGARSRCQSLEQATPGARVVGGPGPGPLPVFANLADDAVDLHVEVVDQVERHRLRRHRQPRAAVLVSAVVAQGQVLEAERQLSRERLAGEFGNLLDLLVEDLDADVEMPEELPLVGVAEDVLVTQLAHLADVVEEHAEEEQIAVDVWIEGANSVSD